MGSSVEEIVARMRANSVNIPFADLRKVCVAYFGEYRQAGSHLIFKTPWPGDPRVNIQTSKGNAKRYQCCRFSRPLTC